MLSISEIATQLLDKSMHADEDKSRTLFLVGSKSVGKSTLLYSFLEKSESVRETLILEYSFGRKSTQKQILTKTVCHFWEYGGKLEMLKNVLLSIPMKGQTFFCVIVDLSKVKTIWNTLETCILALSEYSNDGPIELIIIGGKYDIFKNYDSEIKKHINTTIRSIALIYKAYVIYYSCKDSHQLRKAKEMLFNICFGNGVPFTEKSTNNSKPLLIPKAADSWDNIGVPMTAFDQVKIRHMSRIQPENGVHEAIKLETLHNQPEPILDSLISLKYQELRNLESFEPSMAEYLEYLQ